MEYRSFMKQQRLFYTEEAMLLFSKNPVCARLYFVHTEKEDVVVFIRESHDQWIGLNAGGNPFVFCTSVDHADSGALVWTLQTNGGNVTAVEQYPVWVDMSHCIPETRLRDVSSLEWRVFRDMSGEVASKWRINRTFIYDDKQVGPHARNAVLDSMIEPLY